MFHKFQAPTECPKVEWFKDATKLGHKFKSIRVIRLEKRRVDSIITTNKHGQIVNTARAVGSDSVNKQDLIESFLSRGVLDDSLPPFILVSGELFEGFTRQDSLLEIGQQEWIYVVCELNDGFTIEDAKDEIGLGLNDHVPSKRHNMNDFKKRLKKWINRRTNQGISTNEDDCQKWFNNICHSFTQKKVTGAIESVLEAEVAAESMTPFTKPNAIKKALKLTGLEKVYAFDNKTGASFETMLMSMFREYDEFGVCSPCVSYLKDTIAENSFKQRLENEKKVELFNKVLVERLLPQYNLHKKNGTLDQFKPVHLIGHLPQMIDVETDEIIKCSK